MININSNNKNNNIGKYLKNENKTNNNNNTESFLITEQNNNIRTNHIKTRMDKTEQNSKCWLCGDRDKTINHIISKCGN